MPGRAFGTGTHPFGLPLHLTPLELEFELRMVCDVNYVCQI